MTEVQNAKQPITGLGNTQLPSGNGSNSPLEPSSLPGVNVLLEGPTGTGKTHALGTLADSGVELFVLFTESGSETLAGYWTDRGLPVPNNVHWHNLSRPEGSFALLAESAHRINTMAQDTLHKMQDPQRIKHNQFVEMMKICNNFIDHRTGQTFGDVGSWGPNRAFAIDSLTGINPIAMSMVVGGKPVKSQADWGIAQDQIEKFLRLCTDGCKCHFVLTAHVERELDALGQSKLTVSTLGRALAPKIPPMFSDVIFTVREGSKWTWSTANSMVDLKTRSLPIADNLSPDFGPLLAKWLSRGGRFSPTVR